MGDGTDAKMANLKSTGLTRRGLLGAFAATAITATPTFANAAGFLRGGGDVRRISMFSGRTGESIDTIYWIHGHAHNRYHGCVPSPDGYRPTVHDVVRLPVTTNKRDVAQQIRRCGEKFTAHERPSGRPAHPRPFRFTNRTRRTVLPCRWCG